MKRTDTARLTGMAGLTGTVRLAGVAGSAR
ncbi:hypothetical protein Ga0074812_102210 [Parafrankia irregularis]|uniref:Uncharacterized protein n=1 Tax=Parafrankia irregularis TaxID=795642 RepID=A0A0S4QHJ1_9ACTN|nr:hypothetical protein Ga0074812_102210 [Parafrankia irregularis]